MNAMAVFLLSFILVGVLPLVLRSKGASVFMMLCVGKALMEISSNEVVRVARTVLNSSLPIDDIAKVFIMLLPAVLTVFITKKSAKKKFPFHVFPSFAGGLLAGFWSVSVLASGGDFEYSTTFNYVQANIIVILTVGIVSTLFLFLMERPKPVKPDEAGHEK